MLDYLHTLAHATALPSIWDLHCQKMAAFGFDRLIYGYSRFVTEETLGKAEDAIFLSNHDRKYSDRFFGEKMFVHAPLTRWARDNVGACSWGTVWSDPDALSQTEREIIAFNRSMNVSAGYTISFADPSPRAFGVIALTARPGLDQTEVDEIWAEHGKTIEVMNHMLHLKIISLPHTMQGSPLSKRQREVLEWVGEGKSNQDIATILGVSLPTVEKHLRLAREKLGGGTTAQAVLKASLQNQIFLF